MMMKVKTMMTSMAIMMFHDYDDDDGRQHDDDEAKIQKKDEYEIWKSEDTQQQGEINFFPIFKVSGPKNMSLGVRNSNLLLFL